jgi:hypothetical protein
MSKPPQKNADDEKSKIDPIFHPNTAEERDVLTRFRKSTKDFYVQCVLVFTIPILFSIPGFLAGLLYIGNVLFGTVFAPNTTLRWVRPGVLTLLFCIGSFIGLWLFSIGVQDARLWHWGGAIVFYLSMKGYDSKDEINTFKD